MMYAFRIIWVAQETTTALAQVGLGGYEFGRREERQSTMEVLTEVSSSGLVRNVLQGSARCQPSSRFPTKKLKLKRSSTSSSPRLETAVYFSCCVIHTYSIMLG
jgi:hypothetical protein